MDAVTAHQQLADHFHWAVIVTMVAVRVMQMTIDKIIDVIAMRNGLVAASRAMHMVLGVTAALMLRCADDWIGRRHRQLMLLHATIALDVMQMPIVQVVDVTIVLQAGVFAVGAVLVVVIGVQVSHAENPRFGLE